MALKQIKNKITATQKTGKVTKAMEAVSAVKMRKSQERALISRSYVRAAVRVLSRVSSAREVMSHPLVQKRTSGKTLMVIVTSDKGLAGSVNSAVLKQVEEYCTKEHTIDTICVGRKAVEFSEREQHPVFRHYTNVADGVTIADVHDMASVIIDKYTEGEYKEAIIVYQNFLSTFEQEPAIRKIFPLSQKELLNILKDIRPKEGKYSEMDESKIVARAYTVEPSAEVVLNALIPQLVEIVIYHALLESKACEHSARMVAMKNATDKSKEIVRDLTLRFNKERQAVITAEVSEITGGMEALKT